MKAKLLVETYSGIPIGSEIEITLRPDYIGDDGITYKDSTAIGVGRTPTGILSQVLLGSTEYEIVHDIDMPNLREKVYEVLEPFVEHNSEEEVTTLIDKLIAIIR